jgi:Tol biopolymer transport system component
VFSVGWPSQLAWGVPGQDIDATSNVCAIDPSGRTSLLVRNTRGVRSSGGTISPDGSFLAFESGSTTQLVDTVAVRRLATGADVLHWRGARPAWSGDGRLASFVVEGVSDEKEGLAVLALDGRRTWLFPDTRPDDYTPRWSPDGRRLTFLRLVGGIVSLFVVNVDGSDLRRVTDSETSPGPADWSPDGRLLAFSDRKTLAIETVAPTGGPITRIGTLVGTSPSWSPSGAQIAFASSSELHVANADGSGERTIYRGPLEENSVDWQAGAAPLPRRFSPCIIWGSTKRQALQGGAANDVILGGSGSERINGGAGDDQILAGGGNDVVNDGPGNDYVLAGPGRDIVRAGAGHDFVETFAGAVTIYARNRSKDVVKCGPGSTATVHADTIDVVHGCAHVDRR